jgi:hypothetical protein
MDVKVKNKMEYKGYLINPHKVIPTSYVVATAGQGGKIPKVLESLFTSYGIAKDTIDYYLQNKDEKGVKNGKASSESGG